MHSPFLGELMGTMVLILLGNGVVANVSLKNTYGNGGGLIAITTGWAFAVTIGIFVSTLFGSADAHLNPAVTVGFAVSTGDWSKLSTYIPAQMIGAFVGAILVWLQYLPHWGATTGQGAKLGSFATGPAMPSTLANIISENRHNGIDYWRKCIFIGGAGSNGRWSLFGWCVGVGNWLIVGR